LGLFRSLTYFRVISLILNNIEWLVLKDKRFFLVAIVAGIVGIIIGSIVIVIHLAHFL